MIAAPLWLMSLAALATLHQRIECMYALPAAAAGEPVTYSQALRDAFADALTIGAGGGNEINGGNGVDVDALLEAAAAAAAAASQPQPMHPYVIGRPNSVQLATAEKRVKPSLSISNSLDVLRQQVMLDFARRQMRENMKQINMNRAHLNSIGKRGGSAAKGFETVERPTRLQKNGLYRIALHSSPQETQQQQQQQQQPQQEQQQPQQLHDVFADLE